MNSANMSEDEAVQIRPEVDMIAAAIVCIVNASILYLISLFV